MPLSLLEVMTPAQVLRPRVLEVEEVMRQLQQVELPVRHHFANTGTKRGLYGREMFIPADTVLTGKIHKYEQINVLCAGEMTVLTEQGFRRVRPPFIIVSPPGTKRIAHAHTDCVWLTVHATPSNDVEAIEAEFIAQSEEEWQAFLEEQKKGGIPCLGEPQR